MNPNVHADEPSLRTPAHGIPKTPAVRSDLLAQARGLFALPLLQLAQRAAAVHLEHWPEPDIQRCSLLSIKTGNCPEDCSYCPQSARYATNIDKNPLLDPDTVEANARAAKAAGSSRFCMGAAWRKPPRGKQFETVLESIRRVKALDMECCVTLGLLDAEQAHALKKAGLDVYNHNVDTSPEYYSKVITTRSFDDRVKTLEHVRQAGLQVCCGGILGMGEGSDDRAGLIAFLAGLDPQPESVPLNLLVKVEGTPLADMPDLDPLDLVRCIAVARIMLPLTRLRLSAGRMQLSREAQALCFFAGANSIFSGEKLLTTPLPGSDFDSALVDALTLAPMAVEAAHESTTH
jgi:biotin synthase